MKDLKFTQKISKFNTLPMNRMIERSHVDKMIESVEMMGVIRPIVVCTTSLLEGFVRTYILDGQHLVQALEILGMQIPYFEIKISSEEDVVHKLALLNTSSKSWKLMDFINAHKYINHHYRSLFKLINNTTIEPLMLAQICNIKDDLTQHGWSYRIKNGDFKIENLNYLKDAEKFDMINKSIGTCDRWVKHAFLKAYIKNCNKESYNQNNILNRIEKHIDVVKTLSNAEDAAPIIKKIFA